MKKQIIALAACVAAFPSFALEGSAPSLAQGGVLFMPDGFKQFLLSYPIINGAKPTSVDVAGESATLRYANGGVAKFALEADAMSFHFATVPGGIKDYKFEAHFPISLGANGVKWAIKDKNGVFPKDYGATKLYQGNAGNLALTTADGEVLAFRFPENYAWVELQDLREWKTARFSFVVTTPFNADKKIVVIPFGSDPSKFDAVAARVSSAFFASESAAPKAPPKPALSANLVDGGLSLNCGQMGSFTVSYPKLDLGGDDGNVSPVEKRISGAAATLTYKGGGVITARVKDGVYSWEIDKAPEGLRSMRVEMFVPFNYKDGGSWATDSASGVFPQVYDSKPKLFQGHGGTLRITDANKTTLALGLAENAYLEVQDNREWGWSVFLTQQHIPYVKGKKRYEMKFSLDASLFEQAKLLDRFGQVPRDFPGKIKDEAELVADIAKDEAYYASLKEPRNLNQYGGLAGSGAKYGLKKTGFFHVENIGKGGKDLWVLVDPEGDAFFHSGICGFTGGDDFTNVEGRREAYEWLPPRDAEWGVAWKDFENNGWWSTRAVSFYIANIIRKYGKFDPVDMAKRYVERARAVGFTSIGAFTGFSTEMGDIYRERSFPYVRHLGYGNVKMVKGVRGVFDPFDPATAPTIDAAFARSLPRWANDPLVVGYYLENEQGFEDIPRAVPALDKSFAAKRELVRQLREKYENISAFNEAWALDAKSFDELENRGLPLSTRAAFADMQAYNETFLEAYYKVIHDTFRKYSPKQMLIGNRWQPGTANSEALCRIAGKYNDIISINYYASAIDKAFITRIYNWTGGKPQFWSEFYFTSTKESNAGPSGHDLETQRARGLAYRNYVEQGASLGFLVGTEWFLLLDQSATGRFFEGLNGERAHTGLYNVADRPYKDMFAEMRKAHDAVYSVWLDGKAPFAFDDPRFTRTTGRYTNKTTAGRPVAHIAVDGTQTGYPLRPPMLISSDRLVIGRDADGLEAAFKFAWDDDSLFILATVSDKTPMLNASAPASLWNADAIELFIGSEKLDQGGAMLFTDRQILLGAGGSGQFHVPNVPRQPDIKTVVVPAVDGKGYTLEASIPWTALDVTPKENMELLFDIAIDNSDGGGRTAQIMWNGGARNSSDRSYWGRLQLVR